MTTLYGQALLARGRAAFDELRQGIRDIEFIAEPEAGELRIGCPESIAAGFLVHVLERFSREHPRVKFLSCQCSSRRSSFRNCSNARSTWY